ncbi:uncharacterized protein LOC111388032 [Olea europaea var. sylvestris]|uniref:uncharacterized protein LOC111388032 n=1 Tax=Olea europaea var. sylvestris TaxID=158386 RepID=UPI000C1D7B16|nr:uncharacterized protein LOC111388032 [Olea europaea var. sylvestris]
MANVQNNPIFQTNEKGAADEGNMLVGDFMTPQITQSQSSIVYPPFGQSNFQLKTNVIQLFQNGHQFYRRTEENPHTNVSRFLEMCQHFRYQGISDDAIRLRLFPHTLCDKAIEWLDSQPIASITTWNDLAHKFCTKFFPPARLQSSSTTSLFFAKVTRRILMKPEIGSKSVHTMGLARDFKSNTSIRDYLLPAFKSMVDSSSNRLQSTKTDEALKLFKTMATTSAMWTSKLGVRKKDTRGLLSGCLFCLSRQILLNGDSGSKNNTYGETYNLSWRKHQNFSWSNQNQNKPQGQYQQPKKTPQLEELFGKFMEKTNQYMKVNNQFMRKIEATLQDQNAAIKNLETQMRFDQ